MKRFDILKQEQIKARNCNKIKQCTWVENGIRCKNIATHQEPGSEIALCDKHFRELNDSIADLF